MSARSARIDGVEVLARTPATLTTLLDGLPKEWLEAREGPNTWSVHDVVGHLLHGERTDWMPRVRRILEHGETLPFEPFDRFAQQREPVRTTSEILAEFARVRTASLRDLEALALTDADLDRKGKHPALGTVTLRELLATWVVHDLDHTAQIARVLAKHVGDRVGPWRAYLSILRDRTSGPST